MKHDQQPPEPEMPPSRRRRRNFRFAQDPAHSSVARSSQRGRHLGRPLKEQQRGKCRHQRDRPSHARPAPRRGRDQSHSRAVLSLMPAECAFRRAGPSISDEHRRRNARGAQVPGSRRLGLRSKTCFNFANLCPHRDRTQGSARASDCRSAFTSRSNCRRSNSPDQRARGIRSARLDPNAIRSRGQLHGLPVDSRMDCECANRHQYRCKQYQRTRPPLKTPRLQHQAWQ
jgi:hypothetical protein